MQETVCWQTAVFYILQSVETRLRKIHLILRSPELVDTGGVDILVYIQGSALVRVKHCEHFGSIVLVLGNGWMIFHEEEKNACSVG